MDEKTTKKEAGGGTEAEGGACEMEVIAIWNLFTYQLILKKNIYKVLGLDTDFNL